MLVLRFAADPLSPLLDTLVRPAATAAAKRHHSWQSPRPSDEQNCRREANDRYHKAAPGDNYQAVKRVFLARAGLEPAVEEVEPGQSKQGSTADRRGAAISLFGSVGPDHAAVEGVLHTPDRGPPNRPPTRQMLLLTVGQAPPRPVRPSALEVPPPESAHDSSGIEGHSPINPGRDPYGMHRPSNTTRSRLPPLRGCSAARAFGGENTDVLCGFRDFAMTHSSRADDQSRCCLSLPTYPISMSAIRAGNRVVKEIELRCEGLACEIIYTARRGMGRGVATGGTKSVDVTDFWADAPDDWIGDVPSLARVRRFGADR